ncbi:MAG: mandelate racemase/muconate lactonizing enzyme family protein [Actinobacteria bacterium]|nr:mandelate racemase/muconate lactonizing enzyme family protein [Actinomycetota bacterium]OJU82845.1 MAG: mandelate racemase [Solirubrobacterales bacterium 70-9]
MRIAEVRERAVPISSQIANAYIDFSKMTASVVAIETDVVRDGRPVTGYGFNSNGRYAQSGLLRERFIPRLLEAEPEELVDESGENLDPERVWAVLMRNEKPGGHGERSVAVGVLDMAVWDLVAKLAEVPLHRLLAERFGDGEPDPTVSVYAAGGYYHPGKDEAGLVAEFEGYLALGYTSVKMKVGGLPPADDLRRIEAALGLLDGEGARLAVDANGRFDLARAIEFGEAIEPYGLRWYEEAGDPLDYQLNAWLAESYPLCLATGENLFSMQDARNLVRFGGVRPGLDVLQMDPALSYGLTEYLRTLEAIEAEGFSRRSVVPHGGHQFGLAIAAGLGLGGNESYPGIFQPFGGFADGIAVEDGEVALPEVPGVGFEAKSDLFKVMETI